MTAKLGTHMCLSVCDYVMYNVYTYVYMGHVYEHEHISAYEYILKWLYVCGELGQGTHIYVCTNSGWVNSASNTWAPSVFPFLRQSLI